MLRERKPLGGIETAPKNAWQMNTLLIEGVFSVYQKQ
jgi:hypothetical protein